MLTKTIPMDLRSIKSLALATTMVAVFACNSSGVTRYVDSNNATPATPYTDWSTAATDIQSALDAATDGDLILVTNGTYQTGGRLANGALTNRLVIDKAVTVQSVNGANETIIRGQWSLETTNGPAAIRCVFLANGASLVGFTLTDGATATNGSLANPADIAGGGVYCESTNAFVADCKIIGNTAALFGGGVFNGSLTNCIISGNIIHLPGNLTAYSSATAGGGAYKSVLENCVVSSNRIAAGFGAGASGCVLQDCSVVGNQNLAPFSQGGGGGVSTCTLSNCFLVGNFAVMGGAMLNGSAVSCLIVSNTATFGGGFWGSSIGIASLEGCVLYGNTAAQGGGAFGGTLRNCTVVENTATNSGGGAAGSSNVNCIIYYNTAPNSSSNVASSASTLTSYSCTSPVTGRGSFTNPPIFLDRANGDFRIASNSPCINAGNNAYPTTSVDFEGNPRVAGGTVDAGAFEYQTTASVLSYAWAQRYGLPTDGSADFVDTDGDGPNNWQEWQADTNPTNAASVFQITDIVSFAPGLRLTWQGVSTRRYFLERATNLTPSTPFQTIATNILSVTGPLNVSDPSATNGGPYFYRAGIEGFR